jgi:hypothetical protein
MDEMSIEVKTALWGDQATYQPLSRCPLSYSIASICFRSGKDYDVHLLLALMIIKHTPPTRVLYWKENGSELDLMVVGKLDDRDRDRVCGFVAKGEDGWDVITLKSGGAKTGLVSKADALESAKAQVEQDCK